MDTKEAKPGPVDEQYQARILKGVSRTFALTIPQLPAPLSRVVSNAYLLCRIADTIEDDRDMTLVNKRKFSEMFINVVDGKHPAESFARDLEPLLSKTTSRDEKDLIHHTERVIRITHSLNDRQQRALYRCISIMADGMAMYQESDVRNGLATQRDMDTYCYYVAGVVGEMLTELFCDHSPEIDRHYDRLMRLSVSFGQGLQMTNILKDIWDDRKRNMCWLPADVFRQYGTDLEKLSPDNINAETQQAIGHLVGVAGAHLENALEYTLMIPGKETGLRHFCLWALGMAVLTLRNINRYRDFTSGQQVKISRMDVKSVILVSNLFTRSDKTLRKLFKFYSGDLPQHSVVMQAPPDGYLARE